VRRPHRSEIGAIRFGPPESRDAVALCKVRTHVFIHHRQRHVIFVILTQNSDIPDKVFVIPRTRLRGS
jgi:hypothetical protein